MLSPLFMRSSTARLDSVRASSTLLRTSAGVSTGRLPTLMIVSPTCKPLSADGLVGLMSVITTPRPATPATAFAGARVSPSTGGCSIFCSALPSVDVRGNWPTVTVIVFSCPLRTMPSFVELPGGVAAILLTRSRVSFTLSLFTEAMTSATSTPSLTAGLSGSS